MGKHFSKRVNFFSATTILSAFSTRTLVSSSSGGSAVAYSRFFSSFLVNGNLREGMA